MTSRSNNAEYLRQLRVKAAAKGKCSTCMCRPAKDGRKSCQDCTDRAAALRPEVKRRSGQRVAQGLCGKCGKVRTHDGRTTCARCLENQRLRMLASYRLAGRRHNVCSVCTSLGLPGLSHNRRTHDRYMAASDGWRAA